MPFTSVYSRRDRVVPWRASVDPVARNVEVDGSHLDLLDRPEPLAAIAEALTRANRRRRTRPAANPRRRRMVPREGDRPVRESRAG